MFVEEVRDSLLVLLQRAIFGLWSGMQVVRWVMHSNKVKQGLAPKSMLSLHDATFIGAGSGEDILECCMNE